MLECTKDNKTAQAQVDVDEYLDFCGGKDSHDFSSSPESMDSARAYAEALRELYANLPRPPTVEQRNARVVVTKAEESDDA